MHVLSVELENIKSHERARFEFMPGTNAIVGPNGAGKSTILEAIGWTLFDYLAYSKDNFLRKGATQGTARVTFESGLDGREYTVVRNTKSTYYVFDPTTKSRVAEQKTDVLAWLRQHLGLEPTANLSDFFSSTIGVPQGLFTAIFLEPATRRKAVFDKILKVEEYREAWEALRETANHFQAGLAEADKALAGFQGRLLRMPDLEAQKTQLETERHSSQERLDGAREQLKRWQAGLDEAVALEAAIAQDTRTLDALATRLEFLAKEKAASALRFDESQRAVAEAATLSALVAVYEAAEIELNALRDTIKERDSLRAERSVAQRGLDEATFALKGLADQLASLDRDQAAREALTPDLARQRELEASVAALKAQLGEFKTVEGRLGRTRTEHAQWSERLKQLEADLAVMAPLASAPERARALEAEVAQRQKALNDLQEAELAYREWATQRKHAEDSAESQRKAVAGLDASIAEKTPFEAKAAPLNDLTEKGQTLGAKIEALLGEIERMKTAGSQFQGNLCPILHADCPIMEGRTPQEYYRAQIAEAEGRQAKLATERDALRAAWRVANEAHKQASMLETLRPQAQEARATLAQREVDLAEIIRRSADLPAKKGDRAALAGELEAARGRWNTAQGEAARYAQQPQLQASRDAMLAEQAARDAAMQADAALLAGKPDVSATLSAQEQAIRELGDPRSRAGALDRAIAQRPALESQRAARLTAQIEATATVVGLDARLSPMADLDARQQAANERRAGAETAFRRHLAIAPLVAGHDARRAAAQAAEAEHAEQTATQQLTEKEAAERRSRYDAAQHAALAQQLETLKAEAIRLEQGVGFLNAQLATTEKEMAALKHVQEEMASQIAERERLVTQAAFLEFARDTLKEAGPYVTAAYLANISIEADRFYRDITGQAHLHLRWGNEYEIMLEEDGRDRSFANLSGGEQMAAALSVRLALLKEISAVNVAFFDEPTTNMDEARRSNLAVQIGQIRSFKQLFVISHDDTFEQWIDHVVRVEGRSGSFA